MGGQYKVIRNSNNNHNNNKSNRTRFGESLCKHCYLRSVWSCRLHGSQQPTSQDLYPLDLRMIPAPAAHTPPMLCRWRRYRTKEFLAVNLLMHALLDCRIAMPAKSRCSIYSNQCLLSSQPINACTVETHTLPGCGTSSNVDSNPCSIYWVLSKKKGTPQVWCQHDAYRSHVRARNGVNVHPSEP